MTIRELIATLVESEIDLDEQMLMQVQGDWLFPVELKEVTLPVIGKTLALFSDDKQGATFEAKGNKWRLVE